jgi:hypothetical protein
MHGNAARAAESEAGAERMNAKRETENWRPEIRSQPAFTEALAYVRLRARLRRGKRAGAVDRGIVADG